MTSLRSISGKALILAGLTLSFNGPASATPLPVLGQTGEAQLSTNGDSLVTKVAGCHRARAYGMVYKWGYPAWHRHAGARCRPVAVAGAALCHRAFRKHFHAGLGNVWHKHAGPNCVPVRGRVWTTGPKLGCVKIGAVWICG